MAMICLFALIFFVRQARRRELCALNQRAMAQRHARIDLERGDEFVELIRGDGATVSPSNWAPSTASTRCPRNNFRTCIDPSRAISNTTPRLTRAPPVRPKAAPTSPRRRRRRPRRAPARASTALGAAKSISLSSLSPPPSGFSIVSTPTGSVFAARRRATRTRRSGRGRTSELTPSARRLGRGADRRLDVPWTHP